MFTTLTVALALSGASAIESPTVKADLDRPALVQVAGIFNKGTISSGNRQRGFGIGNVSSGGAKFGNGKGSNRGNNSAGGHLPLQPGNGFFGSPPNKKNIPVLAPQGNGNAYGGGNYGRPPKQDVPVITSPVNGNNQGGGNYGKPPKNDLPSGYANGPSPLKPLEPNKGPVTQPPPGNPPPNNNGISLQEQIKQAEQNKG